MPPKSYGGRQPSAAGWRFRPLDTGRCPCREMRSWCHTGRLQECAVDPATRSARFGAGVTWQQVLDAATPHGLAAVCGSSVNVGATGFLTGGGIGPLSRPLGLASDYITALDVVTGDGRKRRVTADDEPDLFWALRGGKAYLGLVTAVELRLLPITELYGGSVFFDGGDLATVLPAWRDWAASLPTTADTSRRDHADAAAAAGAGPAGRQDHRLGPVRRPRRSRGRGTDSEPPSWPSRNQFSAAPACVPYGQIGEVHNDPVAPAPTGHSTALLGALPDDAVDQLVRLAGPGSGSPQTVVEVRQLGGALAEPLGPRSAFTGGWEAAYNVYLSGQPQQVVP